MRDVMILITIVKTDFPKCFEDYRRKYVKFVSEERAMKIERIKSEKDRIRTLLAGLLIRSQIISRTGLKNEEIFFDYGEYGKPFLRGRDDFYFSVSHSGECVAFVSGNEPVGIDIERQNRGNEKIARRFFTENEYKKIYGTDSAVSFSKIWTSKEAYIKMTGKGLSQGLDTFDVLDGTSNGYFTTFEIEGGYTVTACSVNPERKFRAEVITEEDLLNNFIKTKPPA